MTQTGQAARELLFSLIRLRLAILVPQIIALNKALHPSL
jgi:hypothetical protein